MVSCAACGTSRNASTKEKGVTFHRFPNDFHVRQAWIEFVSKNNWEPRSTSVLCSKHFEDDAFLKLNTKVFLTPDAVPSIKIERLKYLRTFNPEVAFSIRDAQSDVLSPTVLPTTSLNRNWEDVQTSMATQAGSYEKKCAISNCNSRGKMVYDFPNHSHQKMLFDKWMALCQNKELENLQPDDLSAKYGVCERHFEKDVVILPELLPSVDVPATREKTQNSPSKTSQMCRLCLSIASVDLFSYSYSQRVLKDIVKILIPIEINRNDVCRLICEKCKCEVIRFYNFLLKSLRVDEYLRGTNREVDPEFELVKVQGEPTASVEATDEEEEIISTAEDGVKEVEDELPNWYLEPGQDADHKLAEDPSIYAPEFVLKHFHSYANRNEEEGIDEGENKNLKSITCVQCDQVLDNLQEFNKHCESGDHPPIWKCSDCDRTFKSKSELKTHSGCHRKKKDNSCVCDRCGKQFSKREGLNAHLSTAHNRESLKYQCKMCPKKYPTSYRLKVHAQVHTNDRPYCCEKCGAVSTSLANLRSHQAIHSDYKPHVCLICNKDFRQRHQLDRHLTKHTGERKFSCDRCEISYKRQVNLTRHNKRYHSKSNEGDETPRQCALCSYVCNFPLRLRLHMLKEHKSYTCAVCDATFKSYQPYYNHRFKHNPHKKKFVCRYCNKRFIHAALLKVHLVVHTGKKLFECQLCLKRFAQKPHLQSHLLVHTGEKPHKCRYCHKRFAQHSTLVVHERIHTGETPYVCQFCNKGFGHSTNYKKHVLTQHGVVMPKKRNYPAVRRENQNQTVDNEDDDEVVPVIECETEEMGEELVDDPIDVNNVE